MATEQQIQTMLDALQKQMGQVTQLQEENAQLRAQVGQPGTQQSNHTKKPDRPTLDSGMNDREWALFEDSWGRYKKMAKLVDLESIRMELRAACSQDVNKMLFEFVGAETLDTCTEADLLNHIKSVAVRTVHKEVHRMVFNTMVQKDKESVTKFVAALKSQAALCQFKVSCSCDPPREISYADEMVAQRLIAGLANQEHQRRILSEATTLVTLQQKVERLCVLETTEESSSVLQNAPQGPSSSASAVKSKYQKQKRSTVVELPKDPNTCNWCGEESHPEGKPLEKIYCTARNKICRKCKTKGHIASVCMKSVGAAAIGTVTEERSSEEPELKSEASVSFSFDSEDFRPSRKGTRKR